MDAAWRIELLGWLRASQADRVVHRFRSRKAAALLAYRAFFRDRSHPREQLVELLWGHANRGKQKSLRPAATCLRER